MTRINLVPPRLLTDQHLMAERKEINQFSGQFKKSISSKSFNRSKLPKSFLLGTGHVKFFYNYGYFLHLRYIAIAEELEVRHGRPYSLNFSDPWTQLNLSDMYKDYQPDEDAYRMIIGRIKDRIYQKPEWYKYYKKQVDIESYMKLLDEFLDGLKKTVG